MVNTGLFVYMRVTQHDRLWLDPSPLCVPQHLAELGDDDKVLHKNAEVMSVTATNAWHLTHVVYVCLNSLYFVIAFTPFQ